MTDEALNEITKLEQMASILDSTGHYKVLRQVPSLQSKISHLKKMDRTAIICDTETTGLDPQRSEIIDLSLVSISYDEDDNITGVVDIYSSLNEPSSKIDQVITKLTGITNEMVRGKRIDINIVDAIVNRADLIIAHNAAFDRPICERFSSVFSKKPWACSLTGIDWKELGFEGTKLGYLIGQIGLFHESHRALDDCEALYALLSKQTNTQSYFHRLLGSARKSSVRIWVDAPISMRDALRSRSYKWNPGDNGRPRSWWVEMLEENVNSELSFLEKEAHIDVRDISTERLTAFDRFRPYNLLPKVRKNDVNRIVDGGDYNDRDENNVNK